jgi:HEAT repeat protein
LGGDRAKRFAIKILASLVNKHERIKDILIYYGEISAEFVTETYLTTLENADDTLNLLLQIGEPALLLLAENYGNFDLQKMGDIVKKVGDFDSPLALEILLQALLKADEMTQHIASIKIVNHHAKSENYTNFLYNLENPNDLIRWVSAYALGIIGNLDAIPYLEEHVFNDNGFFILLESPLGVSNARGRVKKAAQDAIKMLRAPKQKNNKKDFTIVLVKYETIGEHWIEIR